MNADMPYTILLVEDDDQIRPVISQNLRNHGYHVMVTLNEADAIDRAKGGEFCPSLILVNQGGQSTPDCAAIGRRIRQSAGLDGQTPIVLIAEYYGVDVEGQDIQLSETEYVTYLEDGQQLINLLHRLCPI